VRAVLKFHYVNTTKYIVNYIKVKKLAWAGHLMRMNNNRRLKKKDKRIPSIFKGERTGLCICLWKLAVAVATYVSICIV
jgi:hypothetical protein